MSARAARILRQRVATSQDLRLRLPHTELQALAGPAPEAHEPDPDAYVRGMLLHEGLRPAPHDEDVELRLEPGRAIAGALVVLVPATLVGFAGMWLYGLVLAAVAAGVVVALRRWWPDVARRAPGALPRGFLLGALAGLLAVALVAVAVVLPVRELRRHGTLGTLPALPWG